MDTTTGTGPELTPRQRAEITRRENKARRDAARQAADRQFKEDSSIVMRAMRRILNNDEATPAQLIFAALTVDYLTGGVGYIPGRAQLALDGEPIDLEAFAKAVDLIATQKPESTTQTR